MSKLIDGKAVSQRIRGDLKAEVEKMTAEGLRPGLAVIIVGEDPASQIYVANKEKACAEIGIYSEKYALGAETSEDELIALIERLNKDDKIDGILVQLPLPRSISEKRVLDTISPYKDVDAFHPVNVGKIMIGDYDFLPCTPAGVMELIRETGIEVSGKNCVVIGRSNIVGKPMAMLLMHANGTVTVCHSRTENLADITRRADILVVAIGKADFVTADMVKPGAVVIDVGMNRGADRKLKGDVKFDEVSEVAGYITPVPGGVGPMTITMLMKNAVRSARLRESRK